MSSNPTQTVKPTLAERLATVEEHLRTMEERMVNSFDRSLQQHRVAMGNLTEVIQAMIALQGDGFDDRVQLQVDSARAARAQQEQARAKAVVQNLVDTGVMMVSEVVTEKSVIQTKETDASGNAAGESQFEYNQIVKLEVKEAFLGKKLGEKVEAEGTTFEIVGIFVPNPDFKPAQAEAPVESVAQEVP